MVCSVFIALVLASADPSAAGITSLRIDPPAPLLRGADASQQLLVTALRDGGEFDTTDEAKFQSSQPTIALVTAEGVVLPVATGTAKITAEFGGRTFSVDVKVENPTQLPSLHFGRDIIPVLTKAGCNSGGCHGKQSGQNGFKLSVFGHDIKADYHALVSEGRGRRLSPAAPRQSLLLTKAVNQVPHGGGQRLDVDSTEYRRLLRWVDAGMPRGDDETPHVVAIDVIPKQPVMQPQSRQRLLVTAKYSDGSYRDVTNEAVYTSNDETRATIDPDGRIATTMMAGDSAIVVRYQELIAASFVTVPLNRELLGTAQLAGWNRAHFIDRLVAEKWERLKLSPSPGADEATFHRRVYLDLIGKLPTPVEVTTYLADQAVDKRVQLVDSLLARPEYADYWSLKWADLLRINREDLGPKPAYRYHQWLRRSLERNQPYDEFLRELITAQGNGDTNGAVNFFRAFDKPDDLSVAVSQVFLGVRLDCAKCHHHPYEKWGQDDFYGLAAFFPRLQTKKGTGTDVSFFVGDKGDVKHPQTKEVVSPRVLLGKPLESVPDTDPREHLAAWLAAPDNPFVARALVNRVWAQLMGRGLVEPVDDMRDTNPATNEPLLDALARDFVAQGFDLRRLIRTIATSQVYGLSSLPNADNLRDTQNYSRAYRKRLSAEVLLDAVCDVTGESESFAGMPPGTRAVQLWDHRLPSAFLDTFGRPQRKTVCQCERLAETTLGQVLHLMNAPPVNDKLSSPVGRVAQLAASERAPAELIAELYLAAFGRLPRDDEKTKALAAFAQPGATRRSAAEDILWALLNSSEFVLNH
ncbi:Bacterial Ig-like domain (group 2) [Anatilimnocola aggregata]|uniref:Bacterial Ig-like domain (Group 2) n=1 Tax=Anatilimnocola aggregata TaxID=2528021 RepID=A0A517YDJ9_9BACT|nr:DUF1549 domain-containing protein [Anatilimnocola aggregata]QDU28311.1 Bacterial Ig-like domain (group 2) [Anatilimnocola aggregata]